MVSGTTCGHLSACGGQIDFIAIDEFQVVPDTK
jgi:hypothetical protein